jgi:LysM repeat protein
LSLNNDNFKICLNLCRQKNKEAVEEMTAFLMSQTKNLYYRNLGYLVDIGLPKEEVEAHYLRFINEFIQSIEVQGKKDVLSYYRGFIRVKFMNLVEKTNHLLKDVPTADVYLINNGNGETNVRIEDTIASNEDISKWVNSHEILEEYVYNANAVLNDFEQKVIISFLSGHFFADIAKNFTLPYKQILAIYNHSIVKIRASEALKIKHNREEFYKRHK